MVATRNHPRDFEAPGTPTSESPTKRATRSAVASLSASLPDLSAATSKASSPQNASKSRNSALHVAPPTRHKGSGWSHTPSQLTLIWLAISLPLVIWDTGYVLLRPYSMPGGFLHKPIWTPYGLYGTVDHVYGFPAWESKNGWTAAQGLFNAFETAVYLAYAYIVYAHGHRETVQGRGAPDKEKLGSFAVLGESRTVYGREAVLAVMLAYTTAWITFSKTVLYCKCTTSCCSTLTGWLTVSLNRVDGSIFWFPCYWTQ